MENMDELTKHLMSVAMFSLKYQEILIVVIIVGESWEDIEKLI